MGTKGLSPPVFRRSHISFWESGNLPGGPLEMGRARPGAKGTTDTWNALVPLALVSEPGTLSLWDQTHKGCLRPFRRPFIMLQNGSWFSVHRWLLIQWLGGVRLFLGSSNLRDLDTLPEGWRSRILLGPLKVVLTFFGKDPEAVT